MSTRILLLIVGLAALSSCSSVYKSGQTPDDVYFSPARPQQEYVEVQKDEDKYQTYEEYQDNYRNDRFLRMGVGNRYYLNYYNDYAFSDWRYNMYSLNFNSPWNSYFAWNSYYNPYCYYPGGIYYGNSHASYNYNTYLKPATGKPVAFDARSYSRPNNTYNGTYNNSYYNNTNNNSRYNNSNSFGSTLQRVFSGSNNNNHNNSYTPSSNTYTPSRSYTPSTPSSGGSSGGSTGGSSSGGVSRPGRGGR
jgi:hypothetical protein